MMNKVLDMSTQSSNNNKRIAKNTLLPHALYDGGVAVHEPSLIEGFGGGRLRNIITKKK